MAAGVPCSDSDEAPSRGATGPGVTVLARGHGRRARHGVVAGLAFPCHGLARGINFPTFTLAARRNPQPAAAGRAADRLTVARSAGLGLRVGDAMITVTGRCRVVTQWHAGPSTVTVA